MIQVFTTEMSFLMRKTYLLQLASRQEPFYWNTQQQHREHQMEQYERGTSMPLQRQGTHVLQSQRDLLNSPWRRQRRLGAGRSLPVWVQPRLRHFRRVGVAGR